MAEKKISVLIISTLDERNELLRLPLGKEFNTGKELRIKLEEEHNGDSRILKLTNKRKLVLT